METKSLFLSKTFVGALMVLVSTLLKAFDVDLPFELTEEMTGKVVDGLMGVGAFFGLWGLRTADKKVTVTGKSKE